MATIKAETLSRRQTAFKLGVGPAVVDHYLDAGAFPGAFRVGKRWHIPTSNITRLLNRGVPSAVVGRSGVVSQESGAFPARADRPTTAERIAR